MSPSDLTDSFLCVKEGVHFIKKNDSFLILTNDRKSIIELKDVAFLIWKNLQKPISFPDLLKKIGSEYDVSKEKLTADLKNWLKEAFKEKLIVTTGNKSGSLSSLHQRS